MTSSTVTEDGFAINISGVNELVLDAMKARAEFHARQMQKRIQEMSEHIEIVVTEDPDDLPDLVEERAPNSVTLKPSIDSERWDYWGRMTQPNIWRTCELAERKPNQVWNKELEEARKENARLKERIEELEKEHTRIRNFIVEPLMTRNFDASEGEELDSEEELIPLSM